MEAFTLHRWTATARSTRGQLLDGCTILCDILEGGAASAPHYRIPAGTYYLGFHGPSKFDYPPYSYPERFASIGLTAGHMIEVKGVPGRTAILIHPGDTVADTDGCLLTGVSVIAGPDEDYIIPGGSATAFDKVWPIIAAAINSDGAQLTVHDIP